MLSRLQCENLAIRSSLLSAIPFTVLAMATAQEVRSKKRLLHRLLMSYNDFHQAAQIANLILEEGLQSTLENERGEIRYRAKLLWQALNCAMVVSYARPFSQNERSGGTAMERVPSNFLNLLTEDEKEVHETALEDRNTLLAHSDSRAWNLRPCFIGEDDQRTLVPLSNDTRAPLVEAAVRTLLKICEKFMDHIIEQRKPLEKNLADYLPTV